MSEKTNKADREVPNYSFIFTFNELSKFMKSVKIWLFGDKYDEGETTYRQIDLYFSREVGETVGKYLVNVIP